MTEIKHFDVERAWMDWVIPYCKQWKREAEPINTHDLQEFLKWLVQDIPASEAHITNVEYVQRINKYLTDETTNQ